MEDFITRAEKFLREESLSWGMLLLYVWIIGCGIFFYLRYSSKKSSPKTTKTPGKFKPLIDDLHQVKTLLMESDSHVEEAEEIFERIEKESKILVQQYGEDRHFTQVYHQIQIMFDKAYARLDAKERDQKQMKRFLRDQANQPRSEDDLI